MAMFQPFTTDKFVVSLFEDYSRYIDMSTPSENGSKYREVKLGSDPENGKSEYALSCTFNRTGEYIILGTSKGNLHVVRTGHSKVLSSTRISSANIKNMAISANGKCLVLNSSDRVVRFVTIPEILFGKHQEHSDERRKANGFQDNKEMELVDGNDKENGQVNGGDVMSDNKISKDSDDDSSGKDEKSDGEKSADKKGDAENSGDDNDSDEEDLWKFEVEHKFQDVVNKLQWNAVAISPNTEYVLASTYEAAHDIYMWETSMGSLVKIYEGPKEELVDVEWHPMRSVIAATGLDSGRIYVWTSITPQRWSALAPDFIEVEQNVDYQEREDEFDVEDENEQNQRLLEDEDQEVDIVSGDPVKNVFSIPVSLDLDEDEDDFSSD
jgi:WD40 repeat protein